LKRKTFHKEKPSEENEAQFEREKAILQDHAVAGGTKTKKATPPHSPHPADAIDMEKYPRLPAESITQTHALLALLQR